MYGLRGARSSQGHTGVVFMVLCVICGGCWYLAGSSLAAERSQATSIHLVQSQRQVQLRKVERRAPVHPPAVRVTAPVISVSPPTCVEVIAAVEARGLRPAPGFAVVCPGNARGREGMTCIDVARICQNQRLISIHRVAPYVVANEFENSRILANAPTRCHSIDCGAAAYGY